MPLIHLHSRCNQKCVFCSYPPRGSDKGGEALWAREIAAMGPGLVQFSGGEPLLAGFPELVRLLVFCARNGQKAEMQTNGTLFPSLPPAEQAILVKAVMASGGYFNVNFPAHNAAADLRVTRTEGAFAARVEAVKKLLELGAAVRLTHVISGFNRGGAEKFAAFAAGNFKGLAWIQFSFIKGIGRAAGRIPAYAAAAPDLIKALDLCDRNGLKCEVDHIPPCFLGWHYAKHVDIAKTRAAAPGEHLAEKKRTPACRGCGLFLLCPGPRKDHPDAEREIRKRRILDAAPGGKKNKGKK